MRLQLLFFSIVIEHFSEEWDDNVFSQERDFLFFYAVYKTAPSGQIEMNWQLDCLPACNLSLFVSYFLLISLTNSLIHSNSPFSSLLLCKSISHILLLLDNWDSRKKKSPHNESYEEITKRIKANSKGRTKDPCIIISLIYWSFYQPPVQRVPITAFCDRAQARGLDSALSHTAPWNQLNHISDAV